VDDLDEDESSEGEVKGGGSDEDHRPHTYAVSNLNSGQ
jgi:hypothetical protein